MNGRINTEITKDGALCAQQADLALNDIVEVPGIGGCFRAKVIELTGEIAVVESRHSLWHLAFTSDYGWIVTSGFNKRCLDKVNLL